MFECKTPFALTEIIIMVSIQSLLCISENPHILQKALHLSTPSHSCMVNDVPWQFVLICLWNPFTSSVFAILSFHKQIPSAGRYIIGSIVALGVIIFLNESYSAQREQLPSACITIHTQIHHHHLYVLV